MLKWIWKLFMFTLIQERTANFYAAAICNPPCLLFSNTTDIIAIDYKTSAVHSVVSGLTRAVAIDVHFSIGYIFWSDVTELNIKRSGIDGSGMMIIISNVGCDGLAVDWRTSQLYWTDTTHNKISISNLAGNNQRTLFSSALDEPRDIALDPDSGLMIWTDWGANPKIEKATLSGTQRVAIVTTNLRWPNGIELDTGNKRIYWVDAKVDKIESVDYNGNNRELLLRVTGFHPFGLALIPPFLFSTDWALRSLVHKLDATTGDYVTTSFSISGQPMGIVAYDRSRQPPASNPCAVNNGGCSHFCVVKITGYECICPAGLALKPDGRTCKDKVTNFLLFTDADGKSTNMISLDVNYFYAKRLFSHLGNQRPIALEFDPIEDRVYWTDVTQGLIISAHSNATSVKILFRCNVKVPDGLAIARVGRNIYWTDTGTDRIEVARLDGTRRKLLIKDGLDEPRAIVLDERNGVMYWTDWGSNPKIEKASMDGSSRQSIVTGNLAWPNGLTIDQTTNLMYWADAKLDKIEVSDLNGGNRRVIMSSSADIHPFGLTVHQGMLYWTDWNNKSISRFDLNTRNRDMIITGLQKPMDIHLYNASAIVPGSHPCAVNNGLCSDLCLLKPQGSYQCACPTGIVLKQDGKNCDYDSFYNMSSDKYLLFTEANSAEIYKVPLAVPNTPCIPLGINTNISRPVAVDNDPIESKVYWTDVTLEQVARAYSNGSDLEVIAQHNVINPDGIAVDWIGRNVYWSDANTSKIEVSRLDGSFRRNLFTVNVDKPRAIVLDINARKMYWTDWGVSPKIEQANMDGTARTILVSSGLKWVNSLALDFNNKLLYWCDGQLEKIERVDLQGNNRMLILDLLSVNDSYHPFGLALYEDALFWTDWITKSVHKYNMTSSIMDVLVHGMGRPMEIHIFDYETIASVGPTSCSHLNGDCSHICLPNPNGHQCFCPEGVQLKPGDSSTCQGVNRCPKLSAPAHGRLVPCLNVPGQICQFSCDKGYLLSGTSTRTCKSDGTWTGLQTQCTVVTCPALLAPSGGARQGCTGTTSEPYSTVCQFFCSSGFFGFGSTQRTCLENGSWSGQNFVCKAINCTPLVTPPKALLLTPSCTRTYGSSCIYSCQAGYTSLTGNVTRTCLSSGKWSGININCTDTEPPKFGATCPGTPLVAYAGRDSFTAMINWTEPVATDSSGVKPTVTSNYQSPQQFSQGTHVIIYTAVDQSGNKATCTFAVNVIVINCTSLQVDPGSPLRMSSCGSHYGSQCNFSCAIGYRLNGSSAMTCVAPGNKPPGVWDNHIPVCQAVTCPSLPDLINGVKTGCTDPLSERYGAICSFSCKMGYNLTGSSTRRCLKNGTWSGLAPSCRVINCSALAPLTNGVVSPSSCLSRSTYGQICSFSCITSGYALEGTSARVCGNEGKWTGKNNTFCRDNTPPSFNNTCPKNMVFYVPKCSSSAVVSWSEPTATDNSGHVVVTYPVVRPLANLSIGLYDIRYSAADGEGNRANCSFIVQVARKSCQVLQPPLYGAITSLSCGSAYGSQASINCDEGHRLHGSSVRSCEANGRWTGNTTTCNIVKCSAISAFPHGKILPVQCMIRLGVNFKTECFLQCNDTNGYRLEGPSHVSCLGNGSWSAIVSNVICKDIKPPSIQCPSSMVVSTAAGKSFANVTWRVPVPTDNSNEPLNLSGLLPPQQLNVGGTNIRYDVTDSAGLRSSCVFSITVKDLEPPKINPCPADIKIISVKQWHKLVLPGVTVTDNVGVNFFKTNVQNGSEVTWGVHKITYTASDKAGNHAYCRFLITIADSPCEELPPPKNGAKACETWLAGIMCTVHCNKGYGFANKWVQPVYICKVSGVWWNAGSKGSKKPSLPDCSKTHVPKGALVNGEFHYLTDKCGGEQMKEEIAGNFIQLLMGTSFGQAGACRDNPQCRIENVKVDCGNITTRRKRETTSDKQKSTVPLTVSFSLKVPLNIHSNTSLDLNQTSKQISNDVLAALDKVDMTLNVSGIIIQIDPSKPPEVRLTRLVCEEGRVQIGATCVNCPPGYFFNGTSCQACAVDQYQDQEAQTSCITCPSGTSTSGQQASKRPQDCQDLPKDGTGIDKDSFSKATIAGITVGATIFIMVFVVGIVCVWKQCRCVKRKADTQDGFSNEAYCDTDSIAVKLQELMQSSNA